MTDSDYKLAWIMMRKSVEELQYKDGQSVVNSTIMGIILDFMDKTQKSIEEMNRCF